MSIHRAVAPCYLPNPHNYAQVSHLNEDKTDNRVTNLEWCSNKYNSHYSNSKAVLMLNKQTNEVIRRFEALRDVDEFFGINAHQSVSKCCLHKPKYNSAYGYKWELFSNLNIEIQEIDKYNGQIYNIGGGLKNSLSLCEDTSYAEV